MMRGLAILLFFLATPILADPFEVRSGHHATFDRLTFSVPASTKWSSDREGTRLRLTVEPKAEWSLGSVFERIDRSRIRKVISDKGALVVDLGCDCETRLARHGALLVLDVTDIARNTGLTAAQQELLDQLTMPQFKNTPVIQETEPVTSAGTTDQEKLIEAISRAATQGLLTPVNPGHVVQLPKVSLENMQISGAVQGKSSSIEAEPACKPDQNLAFETWGVDPNFSNNLMNLNASLVGEFDMQHSDVLQQMARSYLYFGFGAEAISILDAENTALRAIAAIMDGQSGNSDLLQQLTKCDRNAAIWSHLAQNSVDEDDTLWAFSALPAHLRWQFGPRAQDIAAKRGQISLAKRLSTMFEHPKQKHSTINAIERAVDTVENFDRVNETLPPEIPAILAAHRQEYADIVPRLDDDLVTAYALAGDFEASFDAAHSQGRDRTAEILEIALTTPNDTDYMTATLPRIHRIPELFQPMQRAQFATRFDRMGFADLALIADPSFKISSVNDSPDEGIEDNPVTTQISLAPLNNGRQILRESESLREKAKAIISENSQ